MAVKQFPQDFSDITSTANKLIGAKPDGTPGSVTVPIGGETWATVMARGNKSGGFAIFITGSGGASPTGKALSLTFIEALDSGAIQAYDYSGAAIPKNLLLQPSGGNVGVGRTDAPTEKLHVSGNILATGSITPGSDKRLKKSIKNLRPSLADILELRPVSYTLKEDSATALGFIADEVREIFPDLILEGKDEEKMLAMNYMGLTAPIVKAIQEQHSIIEALTKRIEALEAK